MKYVNPIQIETFYKPEYCWSAINPATNVMEKHSEFPNEEQLHWQGFTMHNDTCSYELYYRLSDSKNEINYFENPHNYGIKITWTNCDNIIFEQYVETDEEAETICLILHETASYRQLFDMIRTGNFYSPF